MQWFLAAYFGIVYSGPSRLLFVFEMKAKIVIMTDAHTMSECDRIADHAARTC